MIVVLTIGLLVTSGSRFLVHLVVNLTEFLLVVLVLLNRRLVLDVFLKLTVPLLRNNRGLLEVTAASEFGALNNCVLSDDRNICGLLELFTVSADILFLRDNA